MTGPSALTPPAQGGQPVDDPLARLLDDLLADEGRRQALPASVLPLLDAASIDAASVIVQRGSLVEFTASLPLGSWDGAAGIALPPLALPPACSRVSCHDPGARGGQTWGPWLKAAGFGRLLVAALGPSADSPRLLLARRSSRAFPARALQLAGRLARCLALAGHEAGPEEASELTLLYEVSRDLAQAPDMQRVCQVVEETAERIIDWEVLVLISGHEAGRPPLVRGGRRLGASGRRLLEKGVGAAAQELGVACGPLSWSRPPVGEAGPSPSISAEPQLLIFPLVHHGHPPGLLAIQPRAGWAVGENVHRLVAGLASQTALSMARLRTVNTAEEHRLRGLLEALPSGVLVAGRDDRLRLINPAGGNMLKSLWGGEAGAGKSLQDLGLPDRHHVAGEDVEFSALRDQRTYVWRWAPLPGSAASDARVIVLSDVTAERARREQAQQAEKMSALGEMLSGVAHELNNPLSSVVGFSQLLLKQSHAEPVKKRLGIIADEAQRCRRIVENLLDVARTRPPERQPVEINSLIEAVVQLFSYQFRVDNIDLEWEPGKDLPAVMGDRHQLQQVLVNLVGNAHHALKRVAGPRRLTLATGVQGGHLCLTVADTGTGVPTAHQARIFDPFFTTKGPGVGTGLGLPITAKIVADHGGRLSLDSRPGEGATFTVELPATLEAQVPLNRRLVPGPPRGTRILVVDDEDSFRLLLQETLEEQGCKVQTAADGMDGLELIRTHEFDAVVSDLRMPRMGGMQLHRETARLRPALARRFVFITGDLPVGAVRAFLSQCGAPCLSKPFGLQELESALGELALAAGAVGSVVDLPHGKPT